MPEVVLLLVILIALGFMALFYAIEVGGILAWIGWGVVLVAGVLFFVVSGRFPRVRRRESKGIHWLDSPRPAPPECGQEDGSRFTAKRLARKHRGTGGNS